MATQLVRSGGDGQSWYANNPLPALLSVTARDANNCPVSGIVVNWAIVTGGGMLSAPQSTTSSSGVATMGDSVGTASPQVVRASASGLPNQDFTATVASQTPTSVDVALSNNFYTPSDTAVQAGGTVTWTWNGTTHTLTFTSGPGTLPGETVQTTGTKVITFNTVGRYGYHCTLHGGMDGTLTVVH
jgi:plastocyanin